MDATRARPVRGARGLVLAAALLLGAAGAPTDAGAQATLPVPSGHWAHDTVDRLAAAGLLDYWDTGKRPRSSRAIASALQRAARRGLATGSPLAPSAARALDRFTAEYGATGDDAATPDRVRERGQAFLRLHGTRQAAATDGAVDLGLTMSSLIGRRFAFTYRSTVGVAGREVPRISRPDVRLAASAGPWSISFGHRAWAFGPGAHGLILDDAAEFDGLDVTTERPLSLPGWLRPLGRLDASFFLTRLDADSLGSSAWFGAARVALFPHPALQIGLNRTAVVGDRVAGTDLGAGHVASVLIGKHTRPNFEDQLASIDLSARVRLGSWSLMPYAEVGFGDSAGAIVEDPGLVAGIRLPWLHPDLPLSLRYEYTAVGDGARYCGFCEQRRTRWYRHGAPRNRYVDNSGTLIGHPLGGYGRAHRIEADLRLLRDRLAVGLALTRSDREPGNLLYSSLAGRTRAADLQIRYHLGPDRVTRVQLGVRSADDFTRADAALSLRVVF